MMKHPILMSAIFCVASFAQAQHGHVHGEGRLDVAIDRDTISLHLELPLDAAVGFERTPKSDQERAALAYAEKALNDAAGLWQIPPAAACALQSVAVSMPKYAGGNEHADIEARYLFRCARSEALKSIGTTLFKQFKRLYRLEVQRAGPTGQGKQRLTPKAPILNW